MSILIGLIIVFLFWGLLFKIIFGVVGFAFKLTFGIIQLVFCIIGAVFGGSLLAILGFAIVGGLLCLPITLLARRK